MRGSGNLAAEQLPLCIQTFKLRGQNARPDRIGSGEKVHNRVGVREAAQSVEARTQDETDMLLGQVCRYEFGHFHHYLQTQPLRVP